MSRNRKRRTYEEGGRENGGERGGVSHKRKRRMYEEEWKGGEEE